MNEYFNPDPKQKAIRLKGAEYTRFKQSIFKRDGYRCRNPECNSKFMIDLHHKTKRSQGGSDTPENCFTMCRKCHDRIERHKLKEDFLE